MTGKRERRTPGVSNPASGGEGGMDEEASPSPRSLPSSTRPAAWLASSLPGPYTPRGNPRVPRTHLTILTLASPLRAMLCAGSGGREVVPGSLFQELGPQCGTEFLGKISDEERWTPLPFSFFLSLEPP